MKFDPQQIAADVQRQIREMGAADRARGDDTCPFGQTSNAARLWREGFEWRYRQAGLFEVETQERFALTRHAYKAAVGKEAPKHHA